MSLTDCVAEVARAAGRDLTDDELDDLVDELAKRVKERQADATIHGIEDAHRAAADELARDLERGALIAKRHAALNFKARINAVDRIRSQFADNPELGLESVLVGVNRPGLGTRASAAAEQEALVNFYGGGLVADIERSGPDNWRLFVSGTLDRDIARALWAMDLDPKALPKLPKQAVDIAKVVRKWQDVARADANKAGAYIGKLEGYIVRQSHDVFRIRQAGYEAWRDAVLPKLDIARTFGGDADLDTALRAIWKALASGVHLKATSTPAGFKGPRNIAKRVSAERVLHFKSADDWFDYNTSFGTGSVRAAVLRGLELSAQNTGLMRKLGPNPEANFNQIAADLVRGIADPSGQERFAGATGPGGYLRQRLAVVDGTARVPVNALGARISSGVRAWEGWSKLGAAVASAVTDIPIYGSEIRYQGGSLLQGMAEAIAALFKGRGPAEVKELDGLLGVFLNGMRDEAISRFSIAEDGLPGAMSYTNRLFFKFNALTWWTDTLRASAIRSAAHRVAFHSGKGFGELDPDFRRVIGLYGIDSRRWEILRRAAPVLADGRAYATPEAVLALPDELFTPIMGRGRPSASRAATAKRELADQLRTFYSDRAHIAVVEPDARTRAIMTGGTRPGTVWGEFARFVGQFKSFPFAVLQNVVGREIYGRGANSLREALANGHGEMLGLAQLMLWTTLFGYGAMAVKDIAKGRTPRDPNSAKTWTAAMVQGGGLGIYGDFLFGEMRTRFGGGPIATALGPTAGTAEDILDLVGRIRNGDDVAAATVRTIMGNTPFANLLYTRAALDYAFLYRVQETLNPGSVKRMEKRIQKENAQTFLLAPSQYAR